MPRAHLFERSVLSEAYARSDLSDTNLTQLIMQQMLHDSRSVGESVVKLRHMRTDLTVAAGVFVLRAHHRVNTRASMPAAAAVLINKALTTIHRLACSSKHLTLASAHDRHTVALSLLYSYAKKHEFHTTPTPHIHSRIGGLCLYKQTARDGLGRSTLGIKPLAANTEQHEGVMVSRDAPAAPQGYSDFPKGSAPPPAEDVLPDDYSDNVERVADSLAEQLGIIKKEVRQFMLAFAHKINTSAGAVSSVVTEDAYYGVLRLSEMVLRCQKRTQDLSAKVDAAIQDEDLPGAAALLGKNSRVLPSLVIVSELTFNPQLLAGALSWLVKFG